MNYSSFQQNRFIVFFAFLVATFIVGIAGSLQFPTLSKFLTDEVHAEPIFVGAFFSINAIASILNSFLLAKYSDKQSERRYIVVFCCCMGIFNSVTFAFTRHYFVLISAGIFFASLASGSMPQIFALAREYAEKTGKNTVIFNSFVRTQLSLAWVIGPPLSFMIATSYGFKTMYLSATCMYIFAIAVVLLFLPSVERKVKKIDTNNVTSSEESKSLLKNKSVVFLFLAMIFMWTANMMYLIDMPLYVSKALHYPEYLSGELMGLAAGIEIPVMLIAGFLVPKVGKRNLIFIAIVCGITFYSGLNLFSSEIMLFVLQIFNALFVGIIANIGVIYFQDLLPTRMGVASTLFNNAVMFSLIISGLIQGFVTEYYGHETIYLIALVMISISLLLCTQVKSIK